MCVFVCVVCCIQTDVVKERERTEEERRRRRRRSSRQQERREEKSSRRGQHVATSTVDHHKPEDRTDRGMQHKRASRETWHNFFHFPLSTFRFYISDLTRRASKRQQRESEKRKRNGNREKLYLTSTRCTTRPGNQPQRR